MKMNNIVKLTEKHPNTMDSTQVFSIRQMSESERIFKRLMDVTICIVLAPFAIVLIAFAYLATRLSSKGPAIFKQTRVGLKGKVFEIYKIRTMLHNPNGYVDHTKANDNRITKLGLILRKTKIDELPQLYNVLKGDMSLVGPRPERTHIVEQFAREHDYYNLRHYVKPGITGWAQVNKPLATPEENLEKLEYDLYYINNYSIRFDMKILAKTFDVVKKGESL